MFLYQFNFTFVIIWLKMCFPIRFFFGFLLFGWCVVVGFSSEVIVVIMTSCVSLSILQRNSLCVSDQFCHLFAVGLVKPSKKEKESVVCFFPARMEAISTKFKEHKYKTETSSHILRTQIFPLYFLPFCPVVVQGPVSRKAIYETAFRLFS